MAATLETTEVQRSNVVITWQALPDNFVLEDEPVESTAQPLIAGALRESLEIIGYIQQGFAHTKLPMGSNDI